MKENKDYEKEAALLEEAEGRLPKSASLVIRQQLAQALQPSCERERGLRSGSGKGVFTRTGPIDLTEEMVSEGTECLVTILNLAAASRGDR